jgi:hypothetical protein
MKGVLVCRRKLRLNDSCLVATTTSASTTISPTSTPVSSTASTTNAAAPSEKSSAAATSVFMMFVDVSRMHDFLWKRYPEKAQAPVTVLSP